MKPTAEYLRFLKEFSKSGKDQRFNLLKNQLKQVIDREGDRLPQVLSLVERYQRGVMTLHIHGLLPIHGREGFNSCATIKNGMASSAESTSITDTLELPYTRTRKVQASMLVDVRKMGKKSESIINGSYPVVGLNALDECKRRIGNPRKRLGEFSLGKRCALSWFEGIGPQWKFAKSLPLGVNGGNVRISLDETESQIIQGGSHLMVASPAITAISTGSELGTFNCFLRFAFLTILCGILAAYAAMLRLIARICFEALANLISAAGIPFEGMPI